MQFRAPPGFFVRRFGGQLGVVFVAHLGLLYLLVEEQDGLRGRPALVLGGLLAVGILVGLALPRLGVGAGLTLRPTTGAVLSASLAASALAMVVSLAVGFGAVVSIFGLPLFALTGQSVGLARAKPTASFAAGLVSAGPLLVGGLAWLIVGQIDLNDAGLGAALGVVFAIDAVMAGAAVAAAGWYASRLAVDDVAVALQDLDIESSD